MKTYQYNNRINKLKKEVFLRIFVTVVLFVLIFTLGKAVIKSYLRFREVALEKVKIHSEIKSLEEQKKELEAKINLYQDPDFLEKEARRKFNLQKEGEQAVVILPNEEEKSKLLEQNQNKTWPEKIKNWFIR